jgi:hypothetical protein
VRVRLRRLPFAVVVLGALALMLPVVAAAAASWHRAVTTSRTLIQIRGDETERE